MKTQRHVTPSSANMAIYVLQATGGFWNSRSALEVELASIRDAQIEAVGFSAEALRDHPEQFWGL